MANFRDISWPDFCDWIQGKTLKESKTNPYEPEQTILEFTDGSVAIVVSNYDGPYSDVTPGCGIEPPTVRVSDA